MKSSEQRVKPQRRQQNSYAYDRGKDDEKHVVRLGIFHRKPQIKRKQQRTTEIAKFSKALQKSGGKRGSYIDD